MNRIRKHGNIYQVLITGSNVNNASFEILLDNWLDKNFRVFKIQNYHTLQEAQVEAYKHPDIDWYKLVSIHNTNFQKLNNEIKKNLALHELIVEYHAKLVTADELKNNMFNRVMNNGDRFTLVQDLNDIIAFDIVNPWFSNLEDISKMLQRINCLNIIYQKPDLSNSKIIYLVGRTDIGTTYEIRLWPTLIYNWSRYISKNHELHNIKAIALDTFTKIKTMQNNIDANMVLY